jgi:F-type H+-transporting ATPase subunit b
MLNPSQPEFWVLVSFLCFIGLLVYFKVPGLIAGALDARADAIRKELDTARKLREEAQELLADYQRKARQAEGEAKAIVEEARREAEAFAAETRASLKDALERRTRSAEEKIGRAEAQAIGEVRGAAVDAAVAAAERILRQKSGGAAAAAGIDASIAGLKQRLN